MNAPAIIHFPTPSPAMQGADLHQASIHAAYAARYLAYASGEQRGGLETGFYHQSSIAELKRAADCLGFDLVKREAQSPNQENTP